jgi:hypothetical protein
MMTCKLEEMFNRQRKLMSKFMPIEKANGLLETDQLPVDLQTHSGCARLRNMGGRVTEEIFEALNEITSEGTKAEMSDVMHFFAELMIASGLRPEDIMPMPQDEGIDRLDKIFNTHTGGVQWGFKLMLYDVLIYLWSGMNQLKTKPWKQSVHETDELEYRYQIRYAFLMYCRACGSLGITSDELFDLYEGKNKINQERIASGV